MNWIDFLLLQTFLVRYGQIIFVQWWSELPWRIAAVCWRHVSLLKWKEMPFQHSVSMQWYPCIQCLWLPLMQEAADRQREKMQQRERGGRRAVNNYKMAGRHKNSTCYRSRHVTFLSVDIFLQQTNFVGKKGLNKKNKRAPACWDSDCTSMLQQDLQFFWFA